MNEFIKIPLVKHKSLNLVLTTVSSILPASQNTIDGKPLNPSKCLVEAGSVKILMPSVGEEYLSDL